jgi:hypothetical protein
VLPLTPTSDTSRRVPVDIYYSLPSSELEARSSLASAPLQIRELPADGNPAHVRVHPTSLARNAASTPFARDLKSPRTTVTALNSMSSIKGTEGLLLRLYKRCVGWPRRQHLLRLDVPVRTLSPFSTASRLITFAVRITTGDIWTHICTLDVYPIQRLQPPGLCSTRNVVDSATSSDVAFSSVRG